MVRKPPAGLCAFLRLPAERERWRENQGRSGGHRLRHVRLGGGGGPDPLQHLRGAGARGAAGLRQRGRAQAAEEGQARPDHRPVRLHGPAAEHRGQDPRKLSLCGHRVRCERHRHPAPAAVREDRRQQKAHPAHTHRAGRGGGGDPHSPGFQFPGLAAHHVRLR